ncbi:MAG TPA: flagellar basal-body MS-ring/collar protein FliF [Defluviitoga sp.]|nr:flagellar basal-body MS-ring/collar protein FliF [Defluviitoga sp.]HOP24859.1 flagellar basal-body MS-ring/collar protein FliF [Defluviitoga sp.]HPZ28754.1 flagellar basal-body MS-ring/collar protein FliF [Defluviitoga sp.]HQD62903.1 flagellar basal-body MS-ring/collar protein FliF [Defluviitoga sp.]
MEQFFLKIKEWWNKQQKERKTLYIVSVVAIIVLIIVFSLLATRKKYAFLIGGLDQASAGNIIQILEEMGIYYKVDNFGNIYVANQNVAELRMKLASQGIIGFNVQGYELLQKQGLGATSYDKQVNYQIALEGELSKSISSLQGIKAARVHLVIPPRTYYQVGDSPEPSASILLILNPGVTISPDQVKAIINLVSGSVQGLKPQNVKVVDNYSRDLSSQVMIGEGIESANSKFKLKTEVENYYSKKLESSLQSVFGLGNVVVVSEIDLNWEKIEQQERKVQPVVEEEGIILSQQTRTEQSGNRSTLGGIPGVDSNIPPYTYQTPQDSGEYYSKTDIITNYDVNEIYRKTVEDKQGQIANKSFTVFIDFSSIGVENPENLKAQILKSVSTASGTPESNISVVDVPFNRESEILRAQLESELLQKRKRIANITIMIISLIVLIVLVIVINRVMKSRKAARLVEERKKQLEMQAEEAMREAGKIPQELTPEQKIMKEIEELADSKPEEVAEIIKMWLRSQ